MAIEINGTTGISGVDGSATTPALQGQDTNTGISFGSDEVNVVTNGEIQAKVDSSGRVGIGTTTPGNYEASGDDLVVSSSGETGITIVSSTSTGGNLYFADGITGNEKFRGWISYTHGSTDALRFGTTGDERFRIGSAGQLGIGGATYGTSGQVLTSQGPNAAPQWADATALETGTWTPQDGTGLLNMNPTAGTWQRIGDLVRMTFNFSCQTNGNPGGNTTVLINNLPFTTTNHPSFGGCLITINGINADQQLLVNRNGNTITGITFSRSSSLNNANPLLFSNCANNFHLQGEVWFLV